jgi:hypothetical protein
MVGVRCTSETDARARIQPLIDAALAVRRARHLLQGAKAAPAKASLSFDDLAELLLSDEAGRLDAAVRKTRAALRALAQGQGGGAVVAALQRRLDAAGVACKRRLRTGDACAALLDLDVGGHRLGAAGAVAVAEKLDADRDGAFRTRLRVRHPAFVGHAKSAAV